MEQRGTVPILTEIITYVEFCLKENAVTIRNVIFARLIIDIIRRLLFKMMNEYDDHYHMTVNVFIIFCVLFELVTIIESLM